MLLTKTANHAVRAMFLPIAWLITGTWSRNAVDSTIFDEDGLDPQKRYYVLAAMSVLISSGIGVGTSIMGIVSVKTDDFGLACQLAMPLWIFFLGGFLTFGFRAIEASYEVKIWRKMKKEGLLDEFEPGYHTRASMPRAVDLILPVLLTIVLAPIGILVIQIYS